MNIRREEKAMETQVAFLHGVSVSSNIFSSIYQREERAACKGMGVFTYLLEMNEGALKKRDKRHRSPAIQQGTVFETGKPDL